MPRYSPLNPHVGQIREWIAKGASIVDIVQWSQEKLNIKTNDTSVRKLIEREPSLRHAWEKEKLDKKARSLLEAQASAEGVTQVGEDSIIITGKPRTDPNWEQYDGVKPTSKPLPEDVLIADILRNRQLDPEEWEVKQILDNQWEANAGKGKKITLYQFKIWLTRKTPIELIFPAEPKDLQFGKPTYRGPSLDKPITAFVIGDHQAPYHLTTLHDLVLDWLAENQPDICVVHGDLSDFGYISRHRDDPAYDTPVQDCIQASFDILYDYRNAAPDMVMKLRKGNHDDRLRNETLERAERMYGVTAAQYPGDKPEEWVYSLNHLLHLERLGIEYVEPLGTYEFEQVALSDYLAVRHGHYTGKDAAIKTAQQLGHSVVLGHTHRQSIQRRTLWNSITKKWDVVTAVEAGCACEIVGGLGFANAGVPDWQPGFVGITIWSDGRFTADLATFEQDGVLRWRDQAYYSANNANC